VQPARDRKWIARIPRCPGKLLTMSEVLAMALLNLYIRARRRGDWADGVVVADDAMTIDWSSRSKLNRGCLATPIGGRGRWSIAGVTTTGARGQPPARLPRHARDDLLCAGVACGMRFAREILFPA
jgi:hypothetical protein